MQIRTTYKCVLQEVRQQLPFGLVAAQQLLPPPAATTRHTYKRSHASAAGADASCRRAAAEELPPGAGGAGCTREVGNKQGNRENRGVQGNKGNIGNEENKGWVPPHDAHMMPRRISHGERAAANSVGFGVATAKP